MKLYSLKCICGNNVIRDLFWRISIIKQQGENLITPPLNFYLNHVYLENFAPYKSDKCTSKASVRIQYLVYMFLYKEWFCYSLSKISTEALKKRLVGPFFLLTLNMYLAKKGLFGFTRLMFCFAIKAISSLIIFYLYWISCI